MQKLLIYTGLILTVAFCSCRESYNPPVISTQASMLVIEGNLNPAGATSIRLTKTFKLEDTAKLVSENNALLIVEGKDNTTQPLVSSGNGNYTGNLNLTIGSEYRLRIKTASGKEYLSDYVTAKMTPDIDSVNWEQDAEGVHIYVNTNDSSGDSRYYLWNYEETWEIHSYFYSRYIYQNGAIRSRVFPDEDVSVCWKYNKSADILMANSLNLAEDVIYRQPLAIIPPNDEKLGIRYSILVKQYALDKQAYDFFEIMKKNSEEIGSVFGPLPSEIKGNIHSVNNSSEAVIGYITASAEKTQRIFIQTPWVFYLQCYSIAVPDNKDSLAYYFGPNQYIPYDFDVVTPTYYGAPRVCVDCTTRDGSTAKPSYW